MEYISDSNQVEIIMNIINKFENKFKINKFEINK